MTASPLTALPDALNRSVLGQGRWFHDQRCWDVILSHRIFRGKKCTTWIISFALPQFHTNSSWKAVVATSPNVSRCINYTQMPIFINEIWEYQWQSHDGNKQLISEVVLYLCCMNVLRPRSKRVRWVNIRITATFLFLAPEVLDEQSSF